MSHVVVTGAAGFIGSRLVAGLNAIGVTNIVAVDNLERAEKFQNLVDADIADYFDKQRFIELLRDGHFDGDVEAVLHQGACSDTMELNGRYMMENNYRYSCALLDFCQEEDVPLIYASSAAVYGANRSFREEPANERPLNVYGYSKLLFDRVVRRRIADGLVRAVGLRYFNVYGGGEAHKGRMASVAYQLFQQYRSQGRVQLFEGSDGYPAGGQLRDFIAVEDVVKVNLHFFEHPDASGVFNVGTGRAQSFNEVACSVISSCRGGTIADAAALVEEGLLTYRPFPDGLASRYQSYTQADLTALREAGYTAPFLSVQEGVGSYCTAMRGAAGDKN